MIAFGFEKHGGPEVLKLYKIAIPCYQDNEVLIEIQASALNHLDIWVRKGWPGLTTPHILGSDAAGIVSACGSKVTQFKVGDRVAINPGICTVADEFSDNGAPSVSPSYKIVGEQLPGTHCQYISIPEQNCIHLPNHISFEQAAACGLVGMTAWRMLIKRAQMRLGQSVLVIGAGGGVNSIAIQLAKLAGCQVFTVTSSEEKEEKARKLGADCVLNYRSQENWSELLLGMTQKVGFDIVVDNVGKATLSKSIKLVKRGGKIVIVGNTSGPMAEIDLRYIFSKQISMIGSTMGNNDDYRKVMQLLFAGKLQAIISKQYTLDEAVSAMAALEKGQQFGKILLKNA